VLIQAADEIHRDFFIADAIWAELSSHYSEKQCMDLVFIIAFYTHLTMMLDAFGVQLEEL
jgi:4-carboxymuconolactone decarboxylase